MSTILSRRKAMSVMDKVSISQNEKQSKQEERISVRWGISLGNGFTEVPNIILDNYARLGVTPQEAMLLIHIARYCFEKQSDSEAFPSVSRLAAEMGRSKRYVLTLLAKLKEKKLIDITHRDGLPSIYDLSPLAKKCMELASSQPVNYSSPPPAQPVNYSSPPPAQPVNYSSSPPVNYSSPEEEQLRIKEEEEEEEGIQEKAPQAEEIAERLEELGVFPEQAKEIAEKMAEAGLSAEEAEEIFLRTLKSVQAGKPRKEEEVVAIAVQRLRRGQWDGGEKGRRALRKAQGLAIPQPPPPHGEEGEQEDDLEMLWKKALVELEGRVPKATFSANFLQTRLLELQDGVAIIAVSDPAAKAWLEERLSDLVRRVLSAIIGREVEVVFAHRPNGSH
jgi:Mn-dependent DtxR family transcriptional regulator